MINELEEKRKYFYKSETIERRFVGLWKLDMSGEISFYNFIKKGWSLVDPSSEIEDQSCRRWPFRFPTASAGLCKTWRHRPHVEKIDSFVHQRVKMYPTYSYAGCERNSFIYPKSFCASATQPATHFDFVLHFLFFLPSPANGLITMQLRSRFTRLMRYTWLSNRTTAS